MSSTVYRGRAGKRTSNRLKEGSLYADVAKGDLRPQTTLGNSVSSASATNGLSNVQLSKTTRKQAPSQADNESSKQNSKKHRVLTELELATFRTSFCTNHHQNKCPNSDSCEKSHCLTWQRRNPYEISYCPQLCPEIQFVKKSRKMVLYRRCTRGKNCNFAHSKEEELYHPLVYKTKQCSAYPKCSRYFCPFVHAQSEMRDVSQLKSSGLALPSSLQSSDETQSVSQSQMRQVDEVQYEQDNDDTAKTDTEVASGLWYEPPTLSAICGYDDVTFKSLYGYGCSGFAQVSAEDYGQDFDLQNCVAWQTLSPGNQFDGQLMDQFVDPTRYVWYSTGRQVNRYGGGGEFDQLDETHHFSEGLGGELVHLVGTGLEDQFGAFSLRKGPDDPLENYPLNDILVNFMNEIGDK
ncbi:hypothetical protein BgAZ_304340 [Babesia gibsoni]|uniref:C3H1-type domain-containing protein n=1 Tax=Babesia gibsoni TaxID=33632 RepID=A0AAD8LQB4_BABGI|nr:hypothetical protein BgAZ_304340 [Babesia gibsoni]